jgi:hypothetical protein
MISPRTRLILFAVAGAALGLTLGVDVADESYGLAGLVAVAALWLVVGRVSEAAQEAWLLAVILVGYIVGNRGFAQLQATSQLPLLPAEAVLLVAVPALVFRIVMKKTWGIRRDSLNTVILAWIIIASIRLPLDMSHYGAMALRDYATIYYAVFFFIAQDLGGQPVSSRLLRGAFTAAFLLLIPAVVSVLVSPDFLVDHFRFRGTPIIFHKSDLVATSLAAGFFWFWTRWEKRRNWLWFASAAASLLLVGGMASPRAAMFASAVMTTLWVLTGRWRILAAQFGIIAAGAVIAVAVIVFSGKDLKTSAPYSMYEHAMSIFDPNGTGTYINGESGDPGDNNRFRLVWWRDVIEDTIATNPLYGIGFGGDLSARFLIDYDLISDESFAARSPHNVVVTMIGRMGLIGLISWLAVMAGAGVMIWRLLRRGEPDGMGAASVACVVLLSACFGVVLEGPMGAVVFWTALGLGTAWLHRDAPATVAPQGSVDPRPVGDEWPVAKAGAMDTQSAPR